MREVWLAAALAAAGAMAAPAGAQSIEDMYEGQTVTILIGHPPGGSYDLYAQLAAEHLGEHIAGHPNVIVQHMPGGGGRKATAYFIGNTQPDGMTLGIFPDTLGHMEVIEGETAWDSSKFRYLGRFAPATAVFALRADAPAKTVEDMRETETIVACTGRSSRSSQQATALKNLAGLNLRVICGYDGSEASELAVLRGEADMMSQNYASFLANPTHIDSGELKIVVQAGTEREATLPDVPLMQELTDDPEAKQILRFVSAGSPIGRSMMIHPETPEPVIEALRESFRAMIEDPDFLKAAKQRGAQIDYRGGEFVEEIMREIANTPPEMLEKARAAMDDSAAEDVKQ